MLELIAIVAVLSFAFQTTSVPPGTYAVAPLDSSRVLRMDTRTGASQVCTVSNGRAVCESQQQAAR